MIYASQVRHRSPPSSPSSSSFPFPLPSNFQNFLFLLPPPPQQQQQQQHQHQHQPLPRTSSSNLLLWYSSSSPLSPAFFFFFFVPVLSLSLPAAHTTQPKSVVFSHPLHCTGWRRWWWWWCHQRDALSLSPSAKALDRSEIAAEASKEGEREEEEEEEARPPRKTWKWEEILRGGDVVQLCIQVSSKQDFRGL